MTTAVTSKELAAAFAPPSDTSLERVGKPHVGYSADDGACVYAQK